MNMKTFCLALLAMLAIIMSHINVFGQEFKVDGINYKVTSMNPATVEVATHYSFTGMANIPATVTNASITYGVTSIGSSAFAYSRGLSSITIPNSVTSIGESAFSNCTGLTSVTIPNSVISISVGAFSDCSALTSVTVHWTMPLEVNTNVFANVNVMNVILYVPDGTQDAYKNTPVWKHFNIAVISALHDFDIQNNLVQVFPNPVSHSFTVSSPDNLEGNFSYTIIDVEGRIVSQGNSSYTKPISTENLATGNYIINIITERGKQLSQTLIKN
jgi:hypothetical protein